MELLLVDVPLVVSPCHGSRVGLRVVIGHHVPTAIVCRRFLLHQSVARLVSSGGLPLLEELLGRIDVSISRWLRIEEVAIAVGLETFASVVLLVDEFVDVDVLAWLLALAQIGV